MKVPGIIGGIGPESTIEYYRQIIALYHERKADNSYPPIFINSIDMTRMLNLIGAGQLTDVTELLAGEIEKLVAAGADFALLASNTPHIVFDDIQAGVSLPMISIVEETCRRARHLGLSKVGLFGTRFTMQGPTYKKVFIREGLELVVPGADDQIYIHDKYMREWIYGVVKQETKDRLLQIVQSLKQDQEIEGLILGGTEIPLILNPTDDPDIPFLDTTRIHVEAIVAKMLG